MFICKFFRAEEPLIPPYWGVSRIDLSGYSSNIVPHRSTAYVTDVHELQYNPSDHYGELWVFIWLVF
jgi:hypothetical protein